MRDIVQFITNYRLLSEQMHGTGGATGGLEYYECNIFVVNLRFPFCNL